MRIPFQWLKEYINTNLTPKEVAQKLTLAGHALDKPLYEQAGDTVMELEDRGNRGDITGIVGIARDLAALINEKVKYPKLAAIPQTDNKKFSVPISVESDRVIRWRAVNFKGVLVGSSPNQIQKRLRAYGIEVINNIVDITNYIMIETGMPIHAFDLDRVKTIKLRTAKPGESLITFDGTELKFDENDLIAADGEKPLTLTTAVGGRESGITEMTKNILIEAGLYDQSTARRSALRLNVRNETAGRLGKYLHPKYCELAIARTIELMKEILNVDPEPVSFDYYPNKYLEVSVTLSRERLSMAAGEEIDLEEAGKILQSLEFEVLSPRHSGRSPESDPGVAQDDRVEEMLTVKVPYFRTDVTMEDDVIEEILRIRGYDKIPVYLPNRPSPEKLEFPEMDLEERARDVLAKLGFNETIYGQITDENDTKRTGLFNENKVIRLQNSWNQELNIMRPETLSGQLKYALNYKKRDVQEIKIFEIGKSYTKTSQGQGWEKYKEARKIALTANTDFLLFKSFVVTFLKELGDLNPSWEKEKLIIYKEQKGTLLKILGDEVGEVGELKQSLLSNFGLNGNWCHACFSTAKLLKYVNFNPASTIKISLPSFVSEDRTFKVGKDVEVEKISNELERELDVSTEITFLGVFENGELKKENQKNVTFNFKFNPEKAVTESGKLKNLKL